MSSPSETCVAGHLERGGRHVHDVVGALNRWSAPLRSPLSRRSRPSCIIDRAVSRSAALTWACARAEQAATPRRRSHHEAQSSRTHHRPSSWCDSASELRCVERRARPPGPSPPALGRGRTAGRSALARPSSRSAPALASAAGVGGRRWHGRRGRGAVQGVATVATAVGEAHRRRGRGRRLRVDPRVLGRRPGEQQDEPRDAEHRPRDRRSRRPPCARATACRRPTSIAAEPSVPLVTSELPGRRTGLRPGVRPDAGV